jgi:hypothetical protein
MHQQMKRRPDHYEMLAIDRASVSGGMMGKPTMLRLWTIIREGEK